MSREIVAAAVLGADQFPLLALHRYVPERSLPELLAAAGRVGDPARLACCHFAACDTCAPETLVGTGALCAGGRRLVETARGWRGATEGRPQ